MRLVLFVSPSQFEALALAWIGVSTVVITALATAVVKLWPRFAELRGLFDAHNQQVLQNTKAIRELSETVGKHDPIVELVKGRVTDGPGERD